MVRIIPLPMLTEGWYMKQEELPDFSIAMIQTVFCTRWNIRSQIRQVLWHIITHIIHAEILLEFTMTQANSWLTMSMTLGAMYFKYYTRKTWKLYLWCTREIFWDSIACIVFWFLLCCGVSNIRWKTKWWNQRFGIHNPWLL